MGDSRRKRKEILRAFLGLLGIVSVAAVLVVTLMFVTQGREHRLRERLGQFHLSSTMRMFEVSTRLSSIELELEVLVHATSEPHEPIEQITRWRTIQVHTRAMGPAVDSVVALSREWRQPIDPFAATVARAARQYRSLEGAMSGKPGPIEELQSYVTGFGLTLFQLQRLHASTAREMLDQINTVESNNAKTMAVIVGGVSLVALLLVMRILLLLRVRLREHEQTEQALLERERQLWQASKLEALGSLVGGVAHDFNNLLTAILGYTESLLSRSVGNDKNRKALLEIRTAGRRAAALTRQLLVFGRQQVVELHVVDLNLMIRDVEPMLRRLISEDITFRFDLDAGLFNVKVDPGQMEQVLINLAVNARDAMEDGGVLSIRTSNADATDLPVGDYVRLQVEDNGCGMSSETLARVFDPFFTTKEQGKGTGLGLASVHGIVTKAEGHVKVQSELGGGTRFDIYLPRCDEEVTRELRDAEQRSVPRGSETVLIAEDEPLVRELVVSVLRAAGYRTLEAGDGVEALRICAEHSGQVRLILSDVVMPGMGGPEMVQRALELQPGARVVYMSGYSENRSLQESVASGSPFLSKPFDPQQLLQVVRRELDLAGFHDENVSGLATMPGGRPDG